MIRTILGKRGHGKTTLANMLIRGRLYRSCIVVDLFDQFREYPLIDMQALVGRYRAGEDFLRPVRVSIYEPDDFALLCALAQAARQITLVIDEVDFFTSSNSVPRSFYRLVHYSNHYEIDIISTSRRPANIPRDVTSQTDTFYLFRTTEPRDLMYIRDAIGTDAYQRVRTLQRYEYLEYDGLSETGLLGHTVQSPGS